MIDAHSRALFLDWTRHQCCSISLSWSHHNVVETFYWANHIEMYVHDLKRGKENETCFIERISFRVIGGTLCFPAPVSRLEEEEEEEKDNPADMKESIYSGWMLNIHAKRETQWNKTNRTDKKHTVVRNCDYVRLASICCKRLGTKYHRWEWDASKNVVLVRDCPDEKHSRSMDVWVESNLSLFVRILDCDSSKGQSDVKDCHFYRSPTIVGVSRVPAEMCSVNPSCLNGRLEVHWFDWPSFDWARDRWCKTPDNDDVDFDLFQDCSSARRKEKKRGHQRSPSRVNPHQREMCIERAFVTRRWRDFLPGGLSRKW